MANSPDTETQSAFEHATKAAGHPELVEAAHHMMTGALGKAEPLCRAVLKRDPSDVNAMRILADIGVEMGMFDDANALLTRALEIAPDFFVARNSLANLRNKQGRYENALQEYESLLNAEPQNPTFLTGKANTLVRISEHEQAIQIYEQVITNGHDTAGISLSLGHSLKTIGRQKEAISAYRSCLAQKDDLGDAYWSLANLKTFKFSGQDIKTMRSIAAREKINRDDYFHIAFALGKALEDKMDFKEAFVWYKRGNAIRRRLVRYNADVNHQDHLALKSFFTSELISKRHGVGNPDPSPIFIVGLPRAGSTLLEQILASHSQVEGTQELPDIISIARRLNREYAATEQNKYPDVLEQLSNHQLRALGEEYIERTRIHRTDKPFFIDKMPNNFSHIGLIHLILPNAKIIDARRHPMACCFSGYKQLFAKGQNFTYSLGDIGRYYADYVDLMSHWDLILPEKILRVQYENVVAETPAQVRRLLEFCGLEFEEQCLRFYENKRAVKTASSEQVRQPIFKSGVDQWRNFEPFLDPLKSALGRSLTDFLA
jgi:tetratricopeptide (TPR) repeat protein